MKRAKIASLSPAELLPVLRVAKDRRTRDWAIVLVGYLHGCRANEISNFVLDDLNPRTGCLLVRRLKGSLETTTHLTNRREPSRVASSRKSGAVQAVGMPRIANSAGKIGQCPSRMQSVRYGREYDRQMGVYQTLKSTFRQPNSKSNGSARSG